MAGAGNAPPPRRGRLRGCLFKGCLVVVAVPVLLLLLVAWVFFDVPGRIGLGGSAEELFSGPPDAEAAAALKEDLAAAGVTTQGMEVHVLPITGREGSLAVVVLDLSQGFSFQGGGRDDPVVDNLVRLATSDAAELYAIKRVALDYRGDDGKSLLTLTAPTDAIRAFADGTITRQEFMKKIDAKADWQTLLLEEMQ